MPLPLIAGALALGGALAARHGAKGAKRGARKEAAGYGQMADQAQGYFNEARKQGQQSRNTFMDAATGARNFDPSAAMREQAGQMMTDIGEQHQQVVNRDAVNRSSRGMFNSPVGSARLTRDLNDAVGSGISRLAMQGASMRQGALENYARNVGSIYDTDVNQGNLFYNAATGLRGSQVGAEAAGDQATADMWGQIGGAAMGAAGSMIPYFRRRPAAYAG